MVNTVFFKYVILNNNSYTLFFCVLISCRLSAVQIDLFFIDNYLVYLSVFSIFVLVYIIIVEIQIHILQIFFSKRLRLIVTCVSGAQLCEKGS